MDNLKKHHKLVMSIIFLIVIGISVILFYRIYPYSDLTLHADFIKNYINNKGPMPENFLYYLVVLIGALFVPSNLMMSTIAVLSISVLAKFLITVNYISYGHNPTEDTSFKFILAGVLVFSSAIYLPQYFIAHRFYLGSFTFNVWHNSTTIAVMPFAILLFQQTMYQIKEGYTNKRLVIITLLIIINALIKPSYLFVYTGALPLTLLYLKPKIKKIILQMYPFVIALVVVFILKLIIYNNGDHASVEINPLLVYKHHHQGLSMWQLLIYLSLSVVLGFTFPVTAFLRDKILVSNIDVLFSSISLLGGIVIFLLFAETGERWWHGNFFWQIVISGYILFMVIARQSYSQLNIFKLKKINILQIALALHLLFGLGYILRLILKVTYM